ncbi:MAG: N-acetylmuramic acid 6-phosphate etherase [Thermomicrobiales bacterium]
MDDRAAAASHDEPPADIAAGDEAAGGNGRVDGIERWVAASATEGRNPRTVEIDRLDATGIARAILAEDAAVVPAVTAEAAAIGRLAEIVTERLRAGGRLVYAGAGTSGRLGTLDAAECPPTYGTDPAMVVALMAGGPAALTGSIEGAEDDPAGGAADIAGLGIGPEDVVVGIAASGRTPYVLGAVAEARRRGAFVAGLACTRPSALEEVVDLMIAPVPGPEAITGSTRMKAGTAQKLVLNTLTTTVMVRLGKTFGNLMVDVQPSNAKLRYRATRIVAMATGEDEDTARTLLAEACDEPKVAIVMALAGIDAAEARERLERAGGRVRGALDGAATTATGAR